jgi:hypothetical protein
MASSPVRTGSCWTPRNVPGATPFFHPETRARHPVLHGLLTTLVAAKGRAVITGRCQTEAVIFEVTQPISTNKIDVTPSPLLGLLMNEPVRSGIFPR